MLKALRFLGWPLLAGLLLALLLIQRYPQWVGLPANEVHLQQAPQYGIAQEGPVSYADAVTLARTLALTAGVEEIMVIGCAAVFRAALPVANRIYWTEVHARPEGDVSLPETDLSEWQEVERQELPASEKDDVSATLKVLDRP